jgi:hypothetical protein
MPEWEFSILRLRARYLSRDEEDRNRLDNMGFTEWDLVAVVQDPDDKKGLIAFFKRIHDDEDDFNDEPEVEQEPGLH